MNKDKKVVSLKNKVTIHFITIGGIAIALTTLLTILVYYSMFRKQVFEDLHTDAEIVKDIVIDGNVKESDYLLSNQGIRITIVNEDGSVIYDSDADTTGMENHRERPEIIKAFETGEGQAVRHSDTVNQNTYYYAILLQDHVVLRVAKEAKGLISVFYGTLPILFIGILILFIICTLMSRFVTKRIITPIEKMALNINQYEEFHRNVPYEELKPFANTIWIQHDSISKQLKALEKSERVRQEFTANVSHELKTPLTSITGYAELIESGICKPEDMNRFGGEIKGNATRLLHLINDIIELSELDETEIEIKKESLDLYENAKKCVDALVIPAKKHQVTITLSGGSATVYANRDMMAELINNLCDNAIRYNRANGTVHVQVEPDGANTRLTVQDTGIGIPKEHIHRIFERFYRVDKSRSKATGGTGLGLAIVKHIVAKHGENLTIESTVDEGTTITVLIPQSET